MHVDLTGKRALVTGASGGIGYETAKGLLSLGADIIITGRSEEKLALMKDYLLKDTKRDTVTTLVADFSDLAQVHSLIDQAGSLNILVNNAGLLTHKRRLSNDGHELQWQVNFLAPALLSLALASTMQPEGRIVNVASGAHKRGSLDLKDPSFKDRTYSPLGAYAQSKLAMVMLTRHLGQLWKDSGPNVYAVHPGIVRTGFAKNTGALGLAFNLFKPFYLSPRLGARGILNASCSPFTKDDTGRYYKAMQQQKPSRAALDHEACSEVYSYCASLLPNKA